VSNKPLPEEKTTVKIERVSSEFDLDLIILAEKRGILTTLLDLFN
jgi:hypothetical protein